MTSQTASASTGQSVGSKWDGLNPHLLAQIYKLQSSSGDDGKKSWQKDPSSPTVIAAVTEASMEIALNWQSPFENSGTESQAPALAAMMQTGALQPVVAALTGMITPSSATSAMGEATAGAVTAARNKVNSYLSQFQGRTGITKLNSEQVFNGMQPIKINCTLLLRAWDDAAKEVEAVLAQLMEWALPQELSSDGSVIARLANSTSNGTSMVETLMPSLAPVPVSMRYKGRLFKELVIESVTLPLDSPITSNGHFVQLALPVMLCSMTAIDHKDWKSYGPL